MDGAYGGTYCAPMWAKFFAAALKDQSHPSFKRFPWTFGNWDKQYASSASPSASASGSASPSAKPSPGATKTITPGAAADDAHSGADHAQADADQDQDADPQAAADDAPRHAHRRAETGRPRAHHAVRRVAADGGRRRSDGRRRQDGRRRHGSGRRRRALGRRPARHLISGAAHPVAGLPGI